MSKITYLDNNKIDEKRFKLQQYNMMKLSLRESLSLLEGEHFQLMDLDCSVDNNHLIIYPLEEEHIYYNLDEMDIIGLSILDTYLTSILSEKNII